MDDKGRYNGECRRGVCTNRPAVWYNHSTEQYYCLACASMINEYNYADAQRLYGHELCTEGKRKPA